MNNGKKRNEKRKIPLFGLMTVTLLTMGCHHDEPNVETEIQKINEPLHDNQNNTELANEKIDEPNDKVIIEDDPYLILVNKTNGLDPSYSPNDLVLINVLNFHNNPNADIYLRAIPAQKVEQMFQAAMDEQGLLLLARSGYRSYVDQQRIHENYIASHGQEQAETFSAHPGHSEHQTGLALDITANSVGGRLEENFNQTAEGDWIAQNAHRFGFIISYPEGREEDTGYIYEPWHVRYVGVEAATIIFENNWILEEYLDYRTSLMEY